MTPEREFTQAEARAMYDLLRRITDDAPSRNNSDRDDDNLVRGDAYYAWLIGERSRVLLAAIDAGKFEDGNE